MIEKAKNIIAQYSQLSKQIESPENIQDHAKLGLLAKEQAELENLYQHCKKYVFKKKLFSDNASLANEPDEDIASLAREENALLLEQIEKIESLLKVLFIPKDPNDKKNIIKENIVKINLGQNILKADTAAIYTLSCLKALMQ